MTNLLRHANGFPIGSRSFRRETGFTLLEVLVATVILGTAVAALLSLLSGALRNAGRLQGPERALALGESQLNDLVIRSEQGSNSAATLPLDQRIEGRWDDQFRWEAQATRFRSSAPPVPGETILVRIGLDVFWKPQPGAAERKLPLETYQVWQEPRRTP